MGLASADNSVITTGTDGTRGITDTPTVTGINATGIVTATTGIITSIDADNVDATALYAQTGIVTTLTSIDIVGTAATIATIRGTEVIVDTVDAQNIDGWPKTYSPLLVLLLPSEVQTQTLLVLLTVGTLSADSLNATTVTGITNLAGTAATFTTLEATDFSAASIVGTAGTFTDLEVGTLSGGIGNLNIDANAVDVGTNLYAVAGIITTLTFTNASGTAVNATTLDAGGNLYAVSGIITNLTATNLSGVDDLRVTNIDANTAYGPLVSAQL